MPFVSNGGQVDPSLAYHLPGSQVGFTAGGLRLGLEGGEAELSLLGAEDAEPVGLGRTPTVASFFRGPQSE
ncbi:MAG: hypothetical protein M3135_08490, partial [Actinomycetota bacterium]|nr:hypothetical protein [Actinomycetota bacterium]